MKLFLFQFKQFTVITLLFIVFVTCSKNKHWWDVDFEAVPRSGTAPLNVIFTDKSILNIIQWDWEFPGATPAKASGKGPHTVQYKNLGQYNATLTVLYYAGADTIPHSDSQTKYKYIKVDKPN